MSQYIYNRKVWVPTRTTVPKEMLIDPKAAPMDEVWRFIKTSTSVWLAKSHVWSYSKEIIDDLEASCWSRAYFNLLMLVRKGKYRRDLSFYKNVRGCCWAATGTELQLWHPRQKQALACFDIDAVIDHTEGLRVSDTLIQRRVLRNDYDVRTSKNQLKRKSFKDSKNKPTTIRSIISTDYTKYTDDCLEYNIAPISIDEFIRENYSDEERKLYYLRSDSPEYKAIRHQRLREKKKTA